MASIKLLSTDAHKYLADIPPCHWSRHAFTTRSKSGMVLNNACESFNAVIRDARTKPILSMMEWMRRYVMKRCSAKRNGLKNFKGVIMPSVEKMLEKAADQVRNCDVAQADVWEFEVDHLSTGESYVVNLEKKTCGCFRWDLLGIPCYHALACIVRQRLNVEDYVHQAYHVSTYSKTYAPAFHPMPGHNEWPKTNLQPPAPPPFRKMPGRPKLKKRIKEPGEGQGEGQERGKLLVVRAKKKNACSHCGGLGHYKNTCKNPPKPVEPPKGKTGRPRKDPSAPPAKKQRTAPTQQQEQATAAPVHPHQPQQHDFSSQASSSAGPSCISMGANFNSSIM